MDNLESFGLRTACVRQSGHEPNAKTDLPVNPIHPALYLLGNQRSQGHDHEASHAHKIVNKLCHTLDVQLAKGMTIATVTIAIGRSQ
jgi:hypothetical protein